MRTALLFGTTFLFGVCSCDRDSSARVGFAEHEKVISKLVVEKAELTARVAQVMKESEVALAELADSSESKVRDLRAVVEESALEMEEKEKVRSALEAQVGSLKLELAKVRATVEMLTDKELQSFGLCEAILAQGDLDGALSAFVAHLQSFPAGLKAGDARRRITDLRSEIFKRLTERIKKGEVEFSEWEKVLQGLNQNEIMSLLGKPSKVRKVSRAKKFVGEIHVYSSASFGKPLEVLYEVMKTPVLLTPRKRLEWWELLRGQPCDFVFAVVDHVQGLEVLSIYPDKDFDAAVVQGLSTDSPKMTLKFADGVLLRIDPD